MRIAQVAPLQVAVPPRGYGGTERVVSTLTEELVRLGHEVTLFATADSRTSAQLVPMAPHAINFDPTVDITGYHVAMLDEVFERASTFDVIHSHLDYLTLPFTRRASTPTVLTLHDKLSRPEGRRMYTRYRAGNYVSISDSQRGDLPDLNFVATIHHGIEVDRFPYVAKPGRYLAFVGRASPEKRPDVAIQVAKRAGIPLKIAAKVDAHEVPYFRERIAPLLDDPLIEWLGQVDEQQKRALMAHALALLLPIDWPEPFGMVFIEALACGTPVLTCPKGAAPELLEEGVTGFSSNDVDDLARAASAVATLSRRRCRAYAQRHFDSTLMALRYVDVYTRLRGEARDPSHPYAAADDEPSRTRSDTRVEA